MFSMDHSQYRPGQYGAHMAICDLITDKIVSWVLPTRYGKSDVIRCSFLDLYYRGSVSCAVVFSPAIQLRDQLIDTGKIEDMKKRYRISVPDPLHAFSPTAPGVKARRQWTNLIGSHITQSPTLISTTIQYGLEHDLWLASWIRVVTEATGKPPVGYIDEAHLSSEANRIGEFIDKWHSAGGLMSVDTATPFRENQERIPGFKYNLVDTDRLNKYIGTPLGDDKILIKVYDILQGTYEIDADYNYSFAEAWAEKPSPLCDVDMITWDADVTKYIDGLESGIKQLSECDDGIAPRCPGFA
jgi:hypothetical protein